MRPPPRHRLTLFHLARHRQPTLPLWMLLPRLPPRCRTPRRSLQPVIQPTPLYLPYSVSVRRHSPVNAIWNRDARTSGVPRPPGPGIEPAIRNRTEAPRSRKAARAAAPSSRHWARAARTCQRPNRLQELVVDPQRGVVDRNTMCMHSPDTVDSGLLTNSALRFLTRRRRLEAVPHSDFHPGSVGRAADFESRRAAETPELSAGSPLRWSLENSNWPVMSDVSP